MRFTPAEPDDHYQFGHLISKGGRWEMGIYPVLFGYRVRAGLIGSMCCSVDYCAANQTDFLLQLFVTVLSILESLPEDVTPGELERMLPRFRIKPINQDPDCWVNLQALAKELQAKSTEPKDETIKAAVHSDGLGLR